MDVGSVDEAEGHEIGRARSETGRKPSARRRLISRIYFTKKGLRLRSGNPPDYHTSQAPVRAQALYESHGFVVEDLTDGARNDEKVPDCTYIRLRP